MLWEEERNESEATFDSTLTTEQRMGAIMTQKGFLNELIDEQLFTSKSINLKLGER